MKISTVPFVLTAALTFAAPPPNSNQHLERTPSVCSSLSTLRFYIIDLNTYPLESDVYMAEAQALTVDEDLQCPTQNAILISEEGSSDACKKNQELKDRINELKYTSPEDKRLRLNGLNTLCGQLDEMVGCSTQ
ncbi:hypothetical protein BDR22DRAFT_819153 [Usnea florida]